MCVCYMCITNKNGNRDNIQCTVYPNSKHNKTNKKRWVVCYHFKYILDMWCMRVCVCRLYVCRLTADSDKRPDRVLVIGQLTNGQDRCFGFRQIQLKNY